MKEYIKKFPDKPTFSKEGYFDGYILSEKNLGVEVDYIDMHKGHEFYQIETKCTHFYYIIEGSGVANINNEIYAIEKGDTIEIPIQTEFAFKGNLKMIEIMSPPFTEDLYNTHKDTRKNDLI